MSLGNWIGMKIPLNCGVAVYHSYRQNGPGIVECPSLGLWAEASDRLICELRKFGWRDAYPICGGKESYAVDWLPGTWGIRLPDTQKVRECLPMLFEAAYNGDL